MAAYRLFKTTYKNTNGETAEAAKWYCEFRDRNATTRRLPAFTSKAASEELGRNIVKLVEYHKATGGQTDPALSRWLTDLPRQTRAKLMDIGLLSRERAASCKFLVEHLNDFKAFLTANGQTPKHAGLVHSRAKRVLHGCGFKHHSEISPSKVMGFLSDLRKDTDAKRGMSSQTFNFYISAVKQFCRWMVKDRRAHEKPVAHLDGLNVQTDRRHDRRALTTAELHKLLDAARGGELVQGMAGAERVMLYRLARETGLRAGELRSLTRSSFRLNGDKPTVIVQAQYSKRRREDTLPLRPELAETLKAYLGLMAPAATAFPTMPSKWELAKMLRADLEAAEIPYRDDAGQVFDFHGFRHTFITNLARGGVHPKTAQALARHSTITLTMDRYSHSLMGEQAEALEVLPDLSEAARQSARATGTDGAVKTSESGSKNLADCLALFGGFRASEGVSDGRGKGSGDNLVSHAESPAKQGGNAAIPSSINSVKALGIEPRTNGLKVRCSTS